MGEPSRPVLPSSPDREPPLAPSQPRPSLARVEGLGDPERPARLQMAVALLVGLVLVAVPLYLWRRPRAVPVPEPDAAPAASDAGAPAVAPEPPDAAPAPAASPAVTLAPPRVLECHDAGPGHTPPAECDHLPMVEQAIADAILAHAACASASPGGGTVEYVVDVSYARKHTPYYVTVPHEGRTLRSSRVAAACAVEVKKALSATSPGGPHQHGRYKIAVTATYPGS